MRKRPIPLLLGLPFFALVMIAADSLFLPTAFLCRLGDRVARVVSRKRAVVLTPQLAQEQIEPVHDRV